MVEHCGVLELLLSKLKSASNNLVFIKAVMVVKSTIKQHWMHDFLVQVHTNELIYFLF